MKNYKRFLILVVSTFFIYGCSNSNMDYCNDPKNVESSFFEEYCPHKVNKEINYCNDPKNVGKIGTEGNCSGKLIVDSELLKLIVKGESEKKGKMGIIIDDEFVSIEKLKEKNKVLSGYDHRVIYTGQVRELINLFKDKNKINGDITGWDVSNVRYMNGLFLNSDFNQDISKWNVSKVTHMTDMFYGNKKFNQPIGCWNIKRLINADNIFIGADNFDQKIGNWKKHIESLEFELSERDRNDPKFKNYDKIAKGILLKAIYEDVSDDNFYEYALLGKDFFDNKILEKLKPKGQRIQIENCN